MKWIILCVSLLLSCNAFSFSCEQEKPIFYKPIIFNAARIKLTRDYQREHYGIQADSIEIQPKIIVLHWTEYATLSQSFNAFNHVTLTSDRSDLPGSLNVSAHFLVARDGTIYQLMPDNWMARHVIGLNHNAIGIENVGGVNNKSDLTEQQAESDAYLVCHLMKKYPSIQYLIGHDEYLQFKNTQLWLEKNPHYQDTKKDPGVGFMKQVYDLIGKIKPVSHRSTGSD